MITGSGAGDAMCFGADDDASSSCGSSRLTLMLIRR